MAVGGSGGKDEDRERSRYGQRYTDRQCLCSLVA